MVTKKTTSSTAKTPVATTRSKTASALAGKKKTAEAGTQTTSKKAVSKTTAAVADSKKAKIPTVNKQERTASGTKAASRMPGPEERYRMVQTAAYFIAEQHGFQGRSDEHWAAAEREIASRFGK